MARMFSGGERWNGKFHLSPNENIFTIPRMKTLFVLYNTKINQSCRSLKNLGNTKQINTSTHVQCLKLIKI